MMKKRIMAIGAIAMSLLMTVSCGSDDDGGTRVEMADFTIEFSNLEELEGDFIYEGWIIVGGAPISTGTFDGENDEYTFTTVKSDLDSATNFVVSIEPLNDSDPAPANTKILSGSFQNDRANLSIDEIADFSNISGNFEIFTPSDTDETNEELGIWFVSNTGVDTYEAGLDLPSLSAGWIYEGWVIIDGVPVSTGTFTNPESFDDSRFHSGNADTPDFPGEDFIQRDVTSDGTVLLSFPEDGNVTGKDVVVSIEPVPDNDSAPFFIKPLIGEAGNEISPADNGLTRNALSLNIIGVVVR